MPHSFYDGPGLLAALHTSAALGTTDTMIEWRYFKLEAHVYGDRGSSPPAGLRQESRLTFTRWRPAKNVAAGR